MANITWSSGYPQEGYTNKTVLGNGSYDVGGLHVQSASMAVLDKDGADHGAEATWGNGAWSAQSNPLTAGQSYECTTYMIYTDSVGRSFSIKTPTIMVGIQ